MESVLCNLFTCLSYYVWNVLGEGRRVNHQVGEESITDLLMLELKDFSNRSSMFEVHSYNKYQEGNKKNPKGADWEVWFSESNPFKSEWIGFRVQAKIIHLDNHRFKHLHYKKEKQTKDLEKSSRIDQLTPLYCLYIHADSNYPNLDGKHGCSLLLTSQVNEIYNKKKREWRDLKEVENYLKPMMSLVCNDNSCNTQNSLLPSRINKTFENNFFGENVDKTHAGVINKPPKYVEELVKSSKDDKNLPRCSNKAARNTIVIILKNSPK